MRYALLTTTCLALTLGACSQAPSGNSSGSISFNDRSGGSAPAARALNEDSSGPGIDVTAAPGVAFDYGYAFRLPSEKIRLAQKQHAAACEKLGVDHCRITGMYFRLNGENNVEGKLVFKLDPMLARAFGEQGIDAVVAAGGKLVQAEITGTDAASGITKLQTLKAQADAELARLDKELARTDLKTDERAELQSQRATLVEKINSAKTGVSDQQASLATTPMTFTYESDSAVNGFDASAPITSAGNVFVGSATVTIGFVLTLLAALAPPGLIVFLGIWLFRRLRPRKPAPPAES